MSSTIAGSQVGSPRPRGLRVMSSRARLLLLLPAVDVIFIVGLLAIWGPGLSGISSRPACWPTTSFRRSRWRPLLC